MSNKLACGDCKHFWAIRKGTRGGGYVPQSRGHCLARSRYPKDKPGDHVYPAGAKMEELQNHVAKVFVVRKNQVVATCEQAETKKG